MCVEDKYEKLSVHDLLTIKFRYKKYEKSNEGKNIKYPKVLKSHRYDYYDFYNKYNEQVVDYLGLSKHKCLENKEDTKFFHILNSQF